MNGARPQLARETRGAFLLGTWRAFALLLCLGLPLFAQDPPGAETVSRVDRDYIESLAVGADTEGVHEGALAAQLREIYARILVDLDTADVWREQRAGIERRRTDAPDLIAQLQVRLAGELPPMELPAPLDESVDELEPIVAQVEATLNSARARQAELESETERRAGRRAALPDELTQAAARVSELTETLATPTTEGLPAVLVEAQRLAREAELEAAQAQLDLFEQERDAARLLDDLLGLELQEAARLLGQAEQVAEEWRVRLNAARSAEAQAAVDAARQAAEAAAASNPIVAELAKETFRLADRRTGPKGLRSLIEDESAKLIRSKAERDAVRDERESIERKERAVGLSQEIGRLLVAVRDKMPAASKYRNQLGVRRVAEDKAEIERIDQEAEQRAQLDPDRAVRELLDRAPAAGEAALSEDELPVVKQALREAILAQKSVREALLNDLDVYIATLSELNQVETELVADIVEFSEFIDERVLWVRIADPIYEDLDELLSRASEAAARLLDRNTWAVLMVQVPRVVQLRSPELLLKLLLLVALFGSRRSLRRRIVDDAYLVARLRTDNFLYTIRTLALSILLAAPVPLLLKWVAELLMNMSRFGALDPAAGALSTAAAKGLYAVAMVLFVADMLWATCRPKGLAEAHFRWPVASLRLLRRHLKWLTAMGLPIVFLVVMLDGIDERDTGPPLGRLLFMGGQILALVFAWRVLRPEQGVLKTALEKHPSGWVSRLRNIWFPVSVGAPAVLFIMAALGYVYTASALQERLRSTLFLVLALALAHALLTRWLFVARRQLALAQYRKRRVAAQEKADKGEGASVTEEFAEEELDLPSVSEQSLTLVQTATGVALAAGLSFVWADVLPALGFLDGFDLWTTSVEVEKLTALADGNTQVELIKKLVPVTLADAIVSLVALVLTVISARNLPGLLEIMVLQRLPLQRAGRYAVTTISRYLIVIIGLAIMFGSVGIGWSTVQWLAAAVSVGLGFGLQEIFANFVSGLIILFERPIRVGDTVTVGTVTGTVTRIHMRATTIVTWDRTELIVPNREFITNQLVNWTLSDSVLRVIVHVGIAYGSDTKLAEELLAQVAEEHPDVLDDPAPRIVFTEFGDSTLNFELRVFVTDPELYRTIHHPLNNAIDRLFKEHGVEIAFPQRDLHIRTSRAPIEVIHPENVVKRDGPPIGTLPGDEPPEPEPA